MQINTSSAKFSSKGLFSEEIFVNMGIPKHLGPTISSCANHSLASETWGTYRIVGFPAIYILFLGGGEGGIYKGNFFTSKGMKSTYFPQDSNEKT